MDSSAIQAAWEVEILNLEVERPEVSARDRFYYSEMP